MRATPPCTRMSAGTRSSAITAHGARLLGDPRLLGVDDVHDHAALEHLGEAALDAHRPGLLIHLPHATRRRRSSSGFQRLGSASSSGSGIRQDVRLPGREVEALAVVEVDDDRRDRVPLDQQLVEVDDGRLLVVLAVLGARNEHALADHEPLRLHGVDSRGGLYAVCVAEENKEHPAAKAGRYVRAAGIVVGKEIDRRADRGRREAALRRAASPASAPRRRRRPKASSARRSSGSSSSRSSCSA